MIFWILVAAPFVAFAIVVMTTWRKGFTTSYGHRYGGSAEWDSAFGWGLVTLCVSAVIGVIGIPVTYYSMAKVDPMTTQTETYDLRAISTETSTEGRFYFLGSGFINGDRQISFIAQTDGYSTINAVDADRARIYEDEAANPYVEKQHYTSNLWWLAPWMNEVSLWYDDYYFHVPADSIIENYDISLQ